jgi:signal transduction histidine kinase/CheY-like chemotaxis protein
VSDLAREIARVQEKLRAVSDPLGMLEGIFALSPFGVQVYRADGQCLLVNQAFRELFGSEPPPDYNVQRDEAAAQAGILDLVRRAFAGERVFVPATWYDPRDVEHVTITAGRRVAVEATMFPLFDQAGRVGHVAIVFEDVTAEVQARETSARIARLHFVATRLSAASTPRDVAEEILEHGVSLLAVRRAVVGVLSTDGTTVEVLAELGFGDQTFKDRPFPVDSKIPLVDAIRRAAPIYYEDVAAFERDYPEVAAAARGLELGPVGAVPLVGAERAIGAIAFEQRKGTPLGDDERAYLAALAFQAAQALDRARLFREAQEAARRAEEASRAKDEFLGVLSHELRTPLNAIQGWAHLAATRGREDPAFLDRAVEVILRNVRAQVTLVDDMLDVARIIRGKLRLALAPLAVRSAVDAAVESIRPTATARNISVQIDVPADLLVVADADRLQQVVWNLLSNAIKFTGKGGHVSLRAEEVGASVVLSVIDDGIGLAPEDIPYVFDRFRQVDSSTTRAKGGLGLGLAIVRHLVEAHGGSVRASSAGKGAGATFVVELPTASSVEGFPITTRDRATPTSVSAPEALQGARILVVDDEPDAAELLAFVLGERGAEVRTASSKRTAMEVLATFAADVLVTDIGMPGEDGFALLRAVRQVPRLATMPAIALTAFARQDDVDATHAAGFGWHVAKPVDPREIVRVVAVAASTARAAAPGEPEQGDGRERA